MKDERRRRTDPGRLHNQQWSEPLPGLYCSHCKAQEELESLVLMVDHSDLTLLLLGAVWRRLHLSWQIEPSQAEEGYKA